MERDSFAVLDQTLARLHSHGRVTYTALKLQFHLDDAHLAALKEELLYTHPEVSDDAGRGLRWTGSLLHLAQVPNPSQAEACFQQALDIARQQQARSWELRAATNLARLWQQQGKRQEPYDLLAPVYGWFTEGFDTADLQEAKRLLDELSTNKGVNRWPE